MGIWACGALLYTVLLKFAVPIYTGKLRFETKEQTGYHNPIAGHTTAEHTAGSHGRN